MSYIKKEVFEKNKRFIILELSHFVDHPSCSLTAEVVIYSRPITLNLDPAFDIIALQSTTHPPEFINEDRPPSPAVTDY